MCTRFLPLLLFIASMVHTVSAATPVVPKQARIRYLVPSSEPPTGWMTLQFNDAAWVQGTNGFGYDLDTRTNGLRNMSGYWSFDDAVLLGKDSSPNENLLVATGVLPNANGRRNGAAEFRTLGRLTPAGAFPTNMPVGNSAYTISVWLKPDRTVLEAQGGLLGILGYGVNGLRGMGNFLRHGGTAANGFNNIHNYWFGDDIVRNGSEAAPPVNFVDGQWHHLAVTYNGSLRYMYGDGRQMGTSQGQTAPPDFQAVNFSIGSSIEGDRYHGLMDEVVIWKEPLAPNQVQALAAGAAPTELPEPNHVPYAPYLRTDVKTQMHGQRSTAYLRIPFTIGSTWRPDQFKMQVLYDDGFVAYLNGQEIARRNAFFSAFDSTSDSDRADAASVTVEEIHLEGYASLLVKGTNMLAIHLLNSHKDNSDLLFEGELFHHHNDSDGDGLPDSWEREYNFDPFNSGTPGEDFDGDGLTNLEEYEAGTDPTDPNSGGTPQTLTLRIERVDGEVRLSFDALANRSYSIVYRDSLEAPGDWVSLKDFSAQTVAQELSHLDPITVSRFYRLVSPALNELPPLP